MTKILNPQGSNSSSGPVYRHYIIYTFHGVTNKPTYLLVGVLIYFVFSVQPCLVFKRKKTCERRSNIQKMLRILCIKFYVFVTLSGLVNFLFLFLCREIICESKPKLLYITSQFHIIAA